MVWQFHPSMMCTFISPAKAAARPGPPGMKLKAKLMINKVAEGQASYSESLARIAMGRIPIVIAMHKIATYGQVITIAFVLFKMCDSRKRCKL